MKRAQHPFPAALNSGETMIGLMVGMLLSMIVVLTTFATFKVAINTTAQAAQDAVEDAQMTYALMRASMAALDIAYGVTSPNVPSHAHVLPGASLSGNALSSTNTNIGYGTAGNAIVWVRNQGGSTSCAGLLYSADDTGSGGLYALAKASPCSTVDGNSVIGGGWTSTRLTDRAKGTGALSFVLTQTACKPFNLTSSIAGGASLTITATNRSGATLSEQACLVNIP